MKTIEIFVRLPKRDREMIIKVAKQISAVTRGRMTFDDAIEMLTVHRCEHQTEQTFSHGITISRSVK